MSDKMFFCWDCAQEMSKRADACPNCGRVYSKKELKQIRKKSSSIFRWFFYIFIFGLIVALVPLEKKEKINIVKKTESMEIEDWDEGLTGDFEKQQNLNLMLKLAGIEKSISVKDIEASAKKCLLLPVTVEVLKENFNQSDYQNCSKFMSKFYPKTLSDYENNHCKKEGKTSKEIKLCDNFYKIYR